MHALVTCKNEEDSIKNVVAGVFVHITLSHYVYGDFFPDDQGVANSTVLCPNFELVRDDIDVLVTCKNLEDQIKMKALKCSQHFPHYNHI